MTKEELSRSTRLFGEEGAERLSRARVAVFGIGGVGGHAAEALVRSGVGALDIIDGDDVVPSNLNRQMVALHSTIGMKKVDAAALRLLDINPELKLRLYPLRFSGETAVEFDFSAYDCVIDAVDDVSAKVLLAVKCRESGTFIISSMGAGNKFDPTAFKVADIYETSVCPLARVMRHELRKHGIERLCVVFSTEKPRDVLPAEDSSRSPASCAFVPAAAGLVIAGEAVRRLAGC